MEFVFGQHRIDLDRRELRRDGQLVALQPQVFDLLVYLIRNRKRVVSRDDLLAAVWGGRIVSESTLTSRISAVRRAVGDSGDRQKLIRTIPRKGVRFVGAVEELATPSLFHVAEQASRSSGLPGRPSIAVLPFANLSADPEQDYLADGIVEEITTALSRIRWLRVIARNSSFTYKGQAVDVRRAGRELGVQYVIEGSVRKAGAQVRIAAQLLEADDASHLWADRFDGTLERVFEFQDRVALGVAAAIEPALQSAEVRRANAGATTDPTAYELYLRALADFPTCARDNLGRGLALLDRAIALDPEYGPALALASVYRVELENHGWADDSEQNRAAAIALARRALRSGAEDPGVLGRAAVALGRFGEDIHAAVALIDRTLALNPSFADGWYWSGWLRLFAGRPDIAIDHFGASMRLNPRSGRGFHLAGIGTARFVQARFEDAAAILRASTEELPDFTPAHRTLAACYAQLGRLDEARAVAGRLRKLTPSVIPEILLFRHPQHCKLFLSGLRLAASERDPAQDGGAQGAPRRSLSDSRA